MDVCDIPVNRDLKQIGLNLSDGSLVEADFHNGEGHDTHIQADEQRAQYEDTHREV